MDVLIFLAHGSRRQQSNDEIIDLTHRISSLVATKFDTVEPAFLEIASPSLSESIDDFVSQGAKTITVFPYFLNSGNHVEHDIPEIIEEFRQAHPDRRFVLMQHFGKSQSVVDLITNQILDT